MHFSCRATVGISFPPFYFFHVCVSFLNLYSLLLHSKAILLCIFTSRLCLHRVIHDHREASRWPWPCSSFRFSFSLCIQHSSQTVDMHFEHWMFSQALCSESVFIHIQKNCTLEAPSYSTHFPINYDPLLES